MTYKQSLAKMEFLFNGEVVESDIWVDKLGKAWYKNRLLENDFQNYLIEQYDIVLIENVVFSPAVILEQLATEKYDYSYLKYCINEAYDIVSYLELFDKIINGDRFIARIKGEK
jgi:hypothetical protein